MSDRPRPLHSTSQRTERPQPHRPEPISTVWLDFETGRGLDNEGRPIMYDRTAIVAVVGNEDGAHKTIADMTMPSKRASMSSLTAPSATP